MTDFQSSEAILNDLFSSIESKYDKIHTNSENQTEDDDSDSTESLEEKVPEVSTATLFYNQSSIIYLNIPNID